MTHFPHTGTSTGADAFRRAAKEFSGEFPSFIDPRMAALEISVEFAPGALMDVVITAPVMFAPLSFVYTGARGAFEAHHVHVANGPLFDVGALDGYWWPGKEVHWPIFYNSPGLVMSIINKRDAERPFTGFLVGMSSQ